MHQSRSLSRMSRVLLAGAAAFAACANAAVPATSPFGAEASGNFEPSKPLAGGGWQLLSERMAPKPDATSVAALAPPSAASTQVVSPVTATPTVAAPVAGPALANGQRAWSVSPSDGNYRLLIEKWAREAGWTTAPWEPDQDVQIEGADAFTADFKTAIRRVLSATEMTDYSLKPCFYSNNLVRVVKLTTKCDPTK